MIFHRRPLHRPAAYSAFKIAFPAALDFLIGYSVQF